MPLCFRRSLKVFHIFSLVTNRSTNVNLFYPWLYISFFSVFNYFPGNDNELSNELLKGEAIQGYQPLIVTRVVYLFHIVREWNIMHMNVTLLDNYNLRYPSFNIFAVCLCTLSSRQLSMITVISHIWLERKVLPLWPTPIFFVQRKCSLNLIPPNFFQPQYYYLLKNLILTHLSNSSSCADQIDAVRTIWKKNVLKMEIFG